MSPGTGDAFFLEFTRFQHMKRVRLVQTRETRASPHFSARFMCSNDSGKAVISIYDIFGFHPNAKQVCDVMADLIGAQGWLLPVSASGRSLTFFSKWSCPI